MVHSKSGVENVHVSLAYLAMPESKKSTQDKCDCVKVDSGSDLDAVG